MKKSRKTFSLAIDQSLLIAFIAFLVDQAYHISFHLYHQVFFLPDLSTAYYIGFKFIFVFIISLIVLNARIKGILEKSTIIGVVAAALFSILLSYMFPDMYTIQTHMFHAVAIFIGVFVTLEFKLVERLKGRWK